MAISIVRGVEVIGISTISGGPTGICSFICGGAAICSGLCAGIGDLKLECNSSIEEESISPVFIYSANVGPIKAILARNAGLNT